jgi:competence protein ComEC
MSRPLIYPLLALITGIVIGYYYPIPDYLLLSAIILILIFLLFTIRNRWPKASFFLIITFVIILGIFDIQIQQYSTHNDNSINHFIGKGKLRIEGIVIDNPISRPDKIVLVVQCIRIVEDNSYRPVSGNIRLTISDDFNFQYGDFIRVSTYLKKISNFQNPGGFDYERYMNLQGIYATGFVYNNSDIILLRQNTASGIRLKLETFRLYLKDIIYSNASTPQREIIEAMTIGNQNAIPAQVRNNFNKTGTSHILSISGLHIGMVAAITFFFTLLILKSSEYLMLRLNIIKAASAAALLMVVFYSLIAGMGVTVIRSALMALVFLCALFLGRKKDNYNTLVLAALIILVIWPAALFDISFQLSFTAVLAIIHIVPRFSKFSLPLLEGLPLWCRKILRHIYLSIIVCVAATLGTLPLIVFYFNRVSAITIIANLILVPLLGTVALAFSMAFILCAFFSPVIAGFFIKISSFFVQISVYFIDYLASLSWSSFSFTMPNIYEIFMFYLLIYISLHIIDLRNISSGIKKDFLARHPLFLKIIVLSLIIFFLADAIYLLNRDKISGDLRVTAIDVGQGSSILVRFPGGKTMLIDGGGFSDSSFDMGKLVVAPFLYHERIDKIDIVVLSHPHPDHLQGLLYITDNFDVQEIWSTGLRLDDEIFRQWEKIISQKKIKVKYLSAQFPAREINGVKLNILWPLKPLKVDVSDQFYDMVNDESMVIKINYGQISFLLPADISAAVEKKLIKSGQNLHSDVLFVPHHGSSRSSSSDFLRKVSCRSALISAGKNNPFRHPHPVILKRLTEANVNILRTDRDGAITVTTDGTKMAVGSYINLDHQFVSE